jgi:predicted porin
MYNEYNEIKMKHKKRLRAMVLLCALGTTNSYAGDEKAIEYSGSGFMTLSAGKMLGGTSGVVGGYNCPCYIADYAEAAMYDGRSGLQWEPDSKIGLQGSVLFDNQRLSFTVQVVSRGSDNGKADLEWLYGSYKFNNNITLQAGRQRLPMFYYSDSQDIGFSLPWTHLPNGVYGWEVVNFDGASLRYQEQIGDWSAIANLFGGNEHNNDSGYWKVNSNGAQSVTDVKWSNIAGASLTLSKDWFETRLVYMQSNTQETLVSSGWNYSSQTYDQLSGTSYPLATQQIYGLAVNADYQNWLLRTELIQINHPGLNYTDHAQLFGLGYRYQKWQPMITWSEYSGTFVTTGVLPSVEVNTPFIANMQQTISLTLRYDITTSSDLKLQYDNTSNHDNPGYTPNYDSSSLLTLAYDKVF